MAATRPLPPSFSVFFSADALSRDPSTVVVTDPNGNVLWTNPAWHEFAAHNGGETMLGRYGVGVGYCAGISGELRDFFQLALQRCYAEGNVFELDYACSSALKRRFMRLRALPITGAGLVLSHSLVVESSEMPEGESALESEYLNPEGIVLQCGNCRRVQNTKRGQWDWVPAWVEVVDPRVSHGMCELCRGYYFRQRRRTPRVTL